MKRILFFLLLLFPYYELTAQESDYTLVRKGSHIAFQNGERLSKADLTSILDSADYSQYKYGHRKINQSSRLYSLSAINITCAGFWAVMAIGQYHYIRTTPYNPDKPEFMLPASWFLIPCAINTSFAVATWIPAKKIRNRGANVIDSVILGRNNTSLSMAININSLNLSLNF